MEIEMTSLPKTWIFDLDGTLVKHNGYKIDGQDSLLDGAKKMFDIVRENDMVIFVTSRKKKYKEETEQFLTKNNIRFDHIIYEAPYGERILINDKKPSGRKMAFAINTERDTVKELKIIVNSKL